MRYQIEILGETIQVDVRQGQTGLEVAIGDGPHRPARLRGQTPLRTLELGARRHRLVVGPDTLDPRAYSVRIEGQRAVSVSATDARTLTNGKRRGDGGRNMQLLRSAMPGIIVEVRVAAGDAVARGQILLILEAMKMQNEIRATADVVVKATHVEAGQTIAGGDMLIEFEDPPAS